MNIFNLINLNNISSYLITFINTIKIYFLTGNYKNDNHIIFYFPVKAYSKNIVDLKYKLEKHKNIKAFLLYNKESKSEISFLDGSLFLDFSYLKFVPFRNFFLKNIQLFISSYVNYVFPPNSKNIYICHDISDAPMVNKKIEKKIFSALSKLHYIFLSSENVVNYFSEKFMYYKINKKPPILFNTGYLKLDNVIKNIKKLNNDCNQILLAPTYSKQLSKYNMTNKIDEIIMKLINNGYKLIYRPHPLDLTKKGNQGLVRFIRKKYEKYNNFKIDISSSYLKSYSQAKLLITDFSGTAYTFSYSTLKPVIFFSPNEKDLNKETLKNLYYFKDRKNVGVVNTKLKKMQTDIEKLLRLKAKYRSKIFKLRKKRILHINNSLKQSSDCIIEILKIKK